MGSVRQEDLHVKIPALIHLTRLGYRYLPRSAVSRDPETNILPGEFRPALERINRISFTDSAFLRLLSDIRNSLDREDVGKSFFDALRNGLGGLRLIDFDAPENNSFHIMTELPYVNGPNRFRPDITLFLNGLPLAFVEVKSQKPKDGVRSEYERMLKRAGNPALRRFINETQIMVFSNDAEYDENDLIPTKGAFYATSAYNDLVFNKFEEEEKEIFRIPVFPDPAETSRILRDHHLEDIANHPAFRASLSPDTPTHRMLTSLFHVRRLLFFLRYGISCPETRGEDGTIHITKQIIRYPQLFAVRFLEHQLRSGIPGGVWRVNRGSRAALSSVQIRYLSDWYAAENIPVHFFYFVEGTAQAALVRDTFTAHGFRVVFLPSRSDFLSADLWEDSHTFGTLITVVSLQEDDSVPLPSPRGEKQVRRVCFFDGGGIGYTSGRSFPALLRSADPQAVVIEYDQEADLPRAHF